MEILIFVGVILLLAIAIGFLVKTGSSVTKIENPEPKPDPQVKPTPKPEPLPEVKPEPKPTQQESDPLEFKVDLKNGDKGPLVGKCQQRLKDLKFELDVDDDFGDKTEAVVMQFQGLNSVGKTGVIGKQTWAALWNKDAKGPAVSSKPPKGIWVWWLSDLPNDFINKLQKIGCKRVYLKVFDDANYNTFKSQASVETIKKFTDVGIEVFGWGYHFNNKSTIDIAAQISELAKISKNGMNGYVFDLEKEVEDPATHSQVKDLITKFKTLVSAPFVVGYTSFGAPEYHSGVPYKILQDLCDCQFPQIYFESFDFDTNENEVKECLAQHTRMGLNKKPIYPIWSSEPGAKKPATKEELQSFLNRFPGSSIWRAVSNSESGQALNLNYSSEAVQPNPISTGKKSSELFSYYSKESNYNSVYNEVKKWFAPQNGGSVTSNGCVAFMSTALRLVGVDVPKGETSTVTLPFSKYLQNTLKWNKITNADDLLAGDVVLTQDDPKYPGYPAHTYMFVGWKDKSKGIGYVVDNQDFTHERNVFGYGTYNFTPFSYAFRSND